MLETLLGQSSNLLVTPFNTLLTISISFTLGLIISMTYIKTIDTDSYSQGFAHTLVLVPTVVSIIILLIGNNIAGAFSLAGAFSIIRFRSVAGNPKDIGFLLFTMATGLACGLEYFQYALTFTIVLSLLMYIIYLFDFGKQKTSQNILKITVPEDLEFEGIFDEVLDKYTNNYELIRVRTLDLGSLYQLIYTININKDNNHKNLIDELRCRNSNLNITLAVGTTNLD